MNFTNEEQEALNDGLVATRWAVERLRARPVKSIESTAILALAGVVELLAKGLVKAPTDQAQPENEAPTHAPGCTGLVLDIGGPFPCLGNGSCEVEPVKVRERLVASGDLAQSIASVIHGKSTLAMGKCQDVAIAILTELASMPIEMPTWKEIQHEWNGYDDYCATDPDARADRVLLLFRDRIAPILATKDTTIVQYDNERNSSARMIAAIFTAICKSAHIKLREGEGNMLVAAIKDADARIAELEKAHSPIECPICKRVLSLHEIKGGTCDAGHAGSSDIEHSIREQLGWCSDTSEGRHIAIIAELEGQLAEATKVPMVDGKTPGRVMTEKAHELFYAPDKPETPFAWDRLSKAEQRRADETAQTVLRAFGNGAEVLRNVHQQIGNAPGEPSEYYQAIIDAELAKLEPTSEHSPKT